MTEPSSRLPDDTVREILALAGKATPGPWRSRTALHPVDGEYDAAIVTNLDGRPAVIGECFGRVAEDGRLDALKTAAFIASVDPTTISLALSELLAARKVVEAAEKMAGALSDARDWMNGGSPAIASLRDRTDAALHAYRQALGEDMTK